MLLGKQKATFCLLSHQPITHSYSLVENISSAGTNPYSCPGGSYASHMYALWSRFSLYQILFEEDG